MRFLSTARYVGGMAVLGIGFYLIGMLQTVYALLAITFAMSAVTAILGIWYSTRVQEIVPPVMMGRSQTLTAGVSSLMEGAGNALGGVAASASGTVAYMVAGSTSLVLAVLAWITRVAKPEGTTSQDG